MSTAVPSGTTAGNPVSEVTGRAVASRAEKTPLSMDVVIADPVPLGLAGFGLTTLVLSIINVGWLANGATIGVLALAIPFGGGAQLLAGMWAFRRGNTFAATAFSAYGAFWLAYALLLTEFSPKITGGATVTLGYTGLFLFVWGIFTVYMAVASLGAAKTVTAVFVLLFVTYFLLAAGAWDGHATVTKVGGYFGLLTAIAALYTSFADVVNATFKRAMMPTGAPFVR